VKSSPPDTWAYTNAPHLLQFCRLHLQGMQNDCDMIPLMVQSNFKPKGWLGLILGTPSCGDTDHFRAKHDGSTAR
jgi:hypothetical protein